MKSFLRAVLSVGFGLSLLIPAFAFSDVGSHGWALQDLTLRTGPGAAYEVSGEVAENSAIRVLRCQVNWCLVDNGPDRGWTSRERVGFGKTPEGPLFSIQPDYPAGGPGSVCFYEGRNFTGASLCAKSGQVFTDLKLYGYDNRFLSVEINGNVSAAACRDRGFQSYCERIIESQPVLHQYLARNLSSIRVY
ncbi:SH3 domain-containing protein [Devosia soli]|nr:SH3 domain-containing protein [Devosia soli]